jgi:alkanesulfonate monooxygenase SsuD/methylene tetrahydromethanopterin reductase-like flavin-dependent oxidoreductase (luciferase family)
MKKPARAEAEEGAMWYSKMAGKLWSSSDDEIPEQYATWRGLAQLVASLEWEDVHENRALIASPESVSRKVKILESFGIDELLLFTGFGNLPAERIQKPMRLFAEEVMPAFKTDAVVASA